MTRRIAKSKVKAMNSIVVGSCGIRRKARKLKTKIADELKTGNELLTKNGVLTGFSDKVIAAGNFLEGDEFVFSNIENLHNITLKMIFEEVPVKRIRRNEITPYHKAMIVRALVRGYTVEKVKKFYSQYTKAQIKAVERAVRTKKIVVKV